MMTPRFSRDTSVKGIVIGVQPLRETDLIVRLLTAEHGRVDGLARGSRVSKSRFGNTPDLFDCKVFQLHQGRGALPTITTATPFKSWQNLRQNLDALAAASLLCEALAALTLPDADCEPELYEALELGLEALNTATSQTEITKATTLTLQAFLSLSGFLENSPPSPDESNQLKKLVDRIERSTDKEMKSKDFVLRKG